MKLEFILSTLIFVLLAVATVSQLAKPTTVSAFVPISSPVTSAMRQLSGVVRYLDPSNWHFLGASGAVVKAKNNQTGDEFSDTTDQEGQFELSVPSGKYKIWVVPASFPGYKFVPQFKNLPVLFDFKNLPFFGLPL